MLSEINNEKNCEIWFTFVDVIVKIKVVRFLRHGVHVRKQDHSIWNHIGAAPAELFELFELVLLSIRVLDETGS